jgi:sporadic carbohydrate cluster protein (TIGR04323 family)
MKSLRGYISSRVFMNERCPQHIQNLVLRDYCQKMGYKYLLSGTEYAMNNSYLMLQQVIDEIPNINGIVAYSLFQMPEIQKDRLQIYHNILDKSGEIHFVLESLKIEVSSEIERVENIWLVRQTLPSCPENIKVS